ncbi:MAG TPA: hypothetical protein VFE30_12615 [Anaeromyxobacteraceae bacterium]|jgi:hypothetical protein|nr:hypothetical protein [Anaeromyxobacteraceae bacterium]
MYHLLKWGFAAALAAFGAYVLFNWDEVRDSVATWLRDNGLEKSALLEAWVLFERGVAAGRRVVSRLFVRTRKTGVVHVQETTYDDPSRIEDPEVRAELARRRQVRRDVMHLVA